jgi:hypothetical protein
LCAFEQSDTKVVFVFPVFFSVVDDAESLPILLFVIATGHALNALVEIATPAPRLN